MRDEKKDENRTERLHMRITPSNKTALTRMALSDGVTMSEWLDRAIQRTAIRRGVWK